ncbi:MAG: NADH-quinone oxidoreductase subunit NuoE [Bacteroidales bacterium]|jgi:NADH-quinone oxidoreductase subunit E|nr:NADH-quinone oxidoreductase subunit NuoE [Bacteroidales bacterium]
MKNTIDAILKKHIPKEKENLIPVLQSVQKKEGYISPESVKRISNYFRISRSSIYGIATFYSQFRFNPPGRHSIKICLGTACHVQGGDFILKALQAEIGISPGETTDDMRFDLGRVACLGCCALAPVVMIDNKIHSRMSVIKLKELLNKYE